jgi:DNA polymerase III gamma/tau subunit
MKDKRYKYYEDIIEDYLQLTDEQIELPLSIEKHKDKLQALIDGKTDAVLKAGDANDAYKLFLQIKKLEERKPELEIELKETEEILKQFLMVLEGNKLSYKERDEQDKSKNTYLFWLEEGAVKTNR